MNYKKNYKYFLFIVPILYLIVSLFSLPQVGLGWDTSVNLAKGEQVYIFLKTLNVTYLKDYPNLTSKYFLEVPGFSNGHPTSSSFLSFVTGNLLIDVFGFKYYFFHIFNIILSFSFLYFFGQFVYKYFSLVKENVKKKLIVSLFTQLFVISIPYFLIYSLSDIKDLPVLAFSFFSFYFLYEINNKNYRVNYILFLLFFVLALYSKFSLIFLLPLFIYVLIIQVLKYKSTFKLNKKYFLITGLLILFVLTFIFWPQLIFNFKYEFSRVLFLYIDTPILKSGTVPLYVDLIYSTPLILIFIFIFSVRNFILFQKKRNIILVCIWVFPVLLYSIISHNYYEGLRQFLFLIVPLSLVVASFIIDKGIHENMYVFVIMILFLMFLFMTPLHKIGYTNILQNKNYIKNDNWGLSLPYGVEYVKTNYADKKVYYSPANFLLKYYNFSNFEYISTNLVDAQVLITVPNNYWYESEKKDRELYFVKTKTFYAGDRVVIEIWEKGG